MWAVSYCSSTSPPPAAMFFTPGGHRLCWVLYTEPRCSVLWHKIAIFPFVAWNSKFSFSSFLLPCQLSKFLSYHCVWLYDPRNKFCVGLKMWSYPHQPQFSPHHLLLHSVLMTSCFCTYTVNWHITEFIDLLFKTCPKCLVEIGNWTKRKCLLLFKKISMSSFQVKVKKMISKAINCTLCPSTLVIYCRRR